MEKFDQTRSKHGSTVFENDWRHSIRSIGFPRVKPREGMNNITLKDFNLRDERVRGWRRRNMLA